ncbi:MAG TPA: class I SAM-dependent rRNA methyltransferase [Anaerolineaceae bacterium]|nr:class I SAM-dependent rRNA methyltransferase [Anaerolineaceae bacterium]HQH84650.1 class I SAM-dependent rRNA methyltransferase [Anaerolineaceae bacterium]
MAALWLKPGREKSVQQRRPWVFSGAIDHLEGDPGAGETVAVYAADRTPLGWAAYSPQSQIRARIWSWDPADTIDAGFFHRRIRSALARRTALKLEPQTTACRLIHAESDGLPGLVVDRYADVLVIQFLSAGAEHWRSVIIDVLAAETGLSHIYERSDVEVRRLEGLPEQTGWLRSPGPTGVEILENGLRFKVDVAVGQKTGFYLDQRNNRARAGALSAGRDVLNCFCYTGGFTLYALAGGASSVLSVDSSGEALAQGAENLALNGPFPGASDWLEGDVFQLLRKFRDQARQFDLIILDPPKFAPTAAQAERAARGYKDINRLGFKLLRPGGLLATFSCSGGISAELFQKIVADAALDAAVEAQIIEHLHAGPDHPIALNFPEGEYLKGLICQVG